MSASNYDYTLTVFASELFTEEPNVGDGFPNTYYAIPKSTVLNVDQKLVYRVTIFLKTAPTVPIQSDIRLLSTGVFATWKDSIKDFASVSGVRTINNRYFDFTVTATKKGNVPTPTIAPQIRLNGIWQDVSRRSTPVVPTISFTKAAKPPADIPTTVKAPDYKNSNGEVLPGSQTGPFEWNNCKKYWVRYWREGVTFVQGGTDSLRNPSYYKYSVYVKYFDKGGNPINPTSTYYGVEETRNAGFYKKNSPSQKALAVLNEAKNCARSSGGNNTPPPNDDGSRSATVPKGTSLYNPYPHVVTRNYKEIAEWPSDQYDSKVKNLDQLGVLYTDPQLASYTKVEGTNEYKVDSTRSAIKNQWGFRFLYNPTTWNYSFGADNSGIDWGRGNPNNTILVAGTGTISLQLLIDRVADMNTVRYWDRNGRANPVGLPYYPVTLTEEQCAGLLYRGTEYDLEYLFRVLNNNLSENPMFGTAGTATSATKGLETLSANLGYVTSLPFMLKFNDQLRYKVVLTGLSVNHDIFTKEMIPTRTVVNLQLERIPDFFFDQKGDKEKRLRFDKETLLKGIYDSSAASKYTGPARVQQPLPTDGVYGRDYI